jgi:hypothetical protein
MSQEVSICSAEISSNTEWSERLRLYRSKLPLDPVILARAIGASGLIYIVRYGLQKQALL